MSARRWWLATLILAQCIPLTQASARALSVEVRTNRGHDAVYRVGDPIVIEARSSDDAHLLVYEIDAEGYVHVLFPEFGRASVVEGDRTYRMPDRDSDYELVARGPVGQGYVVAIASLEPFRELPWYLRPYDVRAEQMGYYGEQDDEEGVTAEGRVVGDPFVAMERLRRRVLEDPEDPDAYATAYTAYSVGHEVRYPRYLCYDCHRPSYWSWWNGFDPYAAHCRVFDFRVNASWTWGRPYWNGFVPYYVFVYRNDCPPRFRAAGNGYSSWDGWRRWRSLWGGPLRRFKSDGPPTAYDPGRRPQYDPSRRWPKDDRPGYLEPRTRERRDPASRWSGGERRDGEARRLRDLPGWRDPARVPRDPTAPSREPERASPRERRWTSPPPREAREPEARERRMGWPGRAPRTPSPNETRERRFEATPQGEPMPPRERRIETPRERRIEWSRRDASPAPAPPAFTPREVRTSPPPPPPPPPVVAPRPAPRAEPPRGGETRSFERKRRE